MRYIKCRLKKEGRELKIHNIVHRILIQWQTSSSRPFFLIITLLQYDNVLDALDYFWRKYEGIFHLWTKIGWALSSNGDRYKDFRILFGELQWAYYNIHTLMYVCMFSAADL